MSKNTIIGIVIAALLVLGVGSYFIAGITYGNTFNKYNNEYQARYNASKTTYSMLHQKLIASANISKEHADQVMALMDKAVSRYGKNGSQNMLLMIKEQNLNLDPMIMRKVVSIMESGYSDFAASQLAKTDLCRAWLDDMTTFPGSLFASKSPLKAEEIRKAMSDLVLTGDTRKAFDTGVAEPMLPFGKK